MKIDRFGWLTASALAAAASWPLLAGSAVAADDTAASASQFDVAFGVAVTSDYISRGVTQTDHKPAIQGYVEPSYGIVYGGVWASNVAFGGDADTEVDAYFGIRPEFGSLSLDLGYTHAFYLNAPGDDSGEVFAKADFSLNDNATIGAQFFVNPEDSATYIEANTDVTLPHSFGISGAVGLVGGDAPYATWNAGIYYTPLDWAKIDLRYSATNLSDTDCQNVSGLTGNECDGRVMLTFSIDTALSSLKGGE